MDLIDRAAVEKIIDDLLENDNLQASPSVWHGLHMIKQLPSAQPEDWMERNKERILQAGMEGREIEFRIGGRLFAIREKAQ